MNQLQTPDYIVFLLYLLTIAGYGWWIYRKKKSRSETATGFFLAEGSLTWWAIGASLIASNISAEQFIGMSGAGFKLGLAVASYEWMAAATLIVIAVFMVPVFIENKIYTMPQFLSKRYSETVALIMAVFWLLLYILVNLTSILFLGALAISSISGINMYACMVMLGAFALLITLGGMRVIGYTDVLQVFFLVLGGLVTTYLALDLVAHQFSGSGAFYGFKIITEKAQDHMHMILKKDNPNFIDLPGLTVLLGGMWVANINYWGFNQYITQRTLGADIKTARYGILFAAFLKLLMPIIVILPGIAAFVMYQSGSLQNELTNGSGTIVYDKAYPTLLNLLPTGLKGLSFAALTAAIVASLAGKANSIATIFTMDIYKKFFTKNTTEQQTVSVGKIALVTSLLIAVVISPFMGIDKGGLNYIQEYTGFISPGIVAIFLLGLFWKRATNGAAIFATVGGFLFSVFLKLLPEYFNLSFLHPYGFSVTGSTGNYEIPFLDRMGFVFLFCLAGMIVISLVQSSDRRDEIRINNSLFTATPRFWLLSAVIAVCLTFLYLYFW